MFLLLLLLKAVLVEQQVARPEARLSVLMLPLPFSAIAADWQSLPGSQLARLSWSWSFHIFPYSWEKSMSNKHPADRQKTLNVSKAKISLFYGQMKTVWIKLICFLSSSYLLCFLIIYTVSRMGIRWKYWSVFSQILKNFFSS